MRYDVLKTFAVVIVTCNAIIILAEVFVSSLDVACMYAQAAKWDCLVRFARFIFRIAYFRIKANHLPW